MTRRNGNTKNISDKKKVKMAKKSKYNIYSITHFIIFTLKNKLLIYDHIFYVFNVLCYFNCVFLKSVLKLHTFTIYLCKLQYNYYYVTFAPADLCENQRTIYYLIMIN